jgi:transposase-like protein
MNLNTPPRAVHLFNLAQKQEVAYGPSAVELLEAWAEENRVFKRNKVPAEKKILAVILCSAGLSYRDAAELAGDISYVGVRDAVLAFRRSLPCPERKYRGRIALFETRLEVGGVTVYVWLARDLDADEMLAFAAAREGSHAEAERFLDRVSSYCVNRPFAVMERGERYPRGLKNVDKRFQIDTSSGIRDWIGRLFIGRPRQQENPFRPLPSVRG